MDLHSIKLRLQEHLSDGLVLIIGSGLSCAEGLPGMQQLADYLREQLAGEFTGTDADTWAAISELLDKNGLEAALLKIPPTPNIESALVKCIGEKISDYERTAISELFSGKRTLKLTRLLKYIVKPKTGLPIITTNYDRLIEIAAEEAGLGADTMFFGRFIGKLNKKESAFSFCRNAKLTKKNCCLEKIDRALIYKPHGSLDWYSRNGTPVFYAGDLPNCTRLIITPGKNKYRNGYERPFDLHLSCANDAIDKASRFLVIGYGFNDDHLQTHLISRIENGKPILILTRSLSKNARQLALEYRNVISIEQMSNSSGTCIIFEQKEYSFPSIEIWDVDSFVKEVLEP
ncbi:MAG: SIR2 family protein [Desulfovibrio sp.]|nr:SIR2 family protein [Desulfovibrio sp.]